MLYALQALTFVLVNLNECTVAANESPVNNSSCQVTEISAM
jgi:hypothetical protein